MSRDETSDRQDIPSELSALRPIDEKVKKWPSKTYMTSFREQNLCLLPTDNWAVKSDRVCLLHPAIVLTGSPSDMYDGSASLVKDVTLASSPVGTDNVKSHAYTEKRGYNANRWG